MASSLTRRFGLIGVNGMDVVIGRDPEGVVRPYLVEVNPRFSGSMELAERARAVNVFSAHVEAWPGGCRTPRMPSPTAASARRSSTRGTHRGPRYRALA